MVDQELSNTDAGHEYADADANVAHPDAQADGEAYAEAGVLDALVEEGAVGGWCVGGLGSTGVALASSEQEVEQQEEQDEGEAEDEQQYPYDKEDCAGGDADACELEETLEEVGHVVYHLSRELDGVGGAQAVGRVGGDVPCAYLGGALRLRCRLIGCAAVGDDLVHDGHSLYCRLTFLSCACGYAHERYDERYHPVFCFHIYRFYLWFLSIRRKKSASGCKVSKKNQLFFNNNP